MFGLAVWSTVYTAPKLGQTTPTARPGSRAYCIKHITAYRYEVTSGWHYDWSAEEMCQHSVVVTS